MSREYSSPLADKKRAFLDQQRSLGFKANDIESALSTIDRFFRSIEFSGEHVDKDLYDKWLKAEYAKCQTSTTLYQHVSIFRRFLLFMTGMGYPCHIPRLPAANRNQHVPYIYSEDEMSRIFEASDRLRAREHHSESVMIAIPALIRLLYSTAARVSEGLSILNEDVDFGRHAIVLNDTKNGCQRLIPMNPSLEEVLRQYIGYRDRLPVEGVAAPSSRLFVSSLGLPISRRTVGKYFVKILDDAGIPYKSGYQGPRIHDLRHTACVQALKRLAMAGQDVYCALPKISVYMGHKKVADTEYYLRLTAELFPEIIKLDSTVTACIATTLRNCVVNADGEDKIG